MSSTTDRRWSVPGFGYLTIGPWDAHRSLLWIAASGLALATVLAIFGFPPIELHLPTHHLGLMGPLCGMTRSAARASVGDLAGSWRYNPGGVVLVVGAWAAVLRAVVGRTTGRWINLRLLVTARGWWVIALVLAGLTLNQQLHADLLA